MSSSHDGWICAVAHTERVMRVAGQRKDTMTYIVCDRRSDPYKFYGVRSFDVRRMSTNENDSYPNWLLVLKSKTDRMDQRVGLGTLLYD